METYDLPPNDLSVQETKTEKTGALSFKIRRVHCSNADQNKAGRGLLAEVKWIPESGLKRRRKSKLQLINYNVCLPRDIMSMGDTSKWDRDGRAKHLIGGHGEGMKIGKEMHISPCYWIYLHVALSRHQCALS